MRVTKSKKKKKKSDPVLFTTCDSWVVPERACCCATVVVLAPKSSMVIGVFSSSDTHLDKSLPGFQGVGYCNEGSIVGNWTSSTTRWSCFCRGDKIKVVVDRRSSRCNIEFWNNGFVIGSARRDSGLGFSIAAYLFG
eukprot:RCo047620